MRLIEIAVTAALFLNFSIGCVGKAQTVPELRQDIEVANSFNKTAFDLYKEIIKESEKENLIFSPYSINIAMTMALSGARGETAKEIQQALNYLYSIDSVGKSLKKFSKDLSKMKDHKKIFFTSANGFALVQPHLIIKDYVEELSAVYSANIFGTRDVNVINAWVKKKTYGKIDGMLKELPKDTAAVILNGVYFKGIWENKFDIEDTRDQDFQLSSKENLIVPMMYQKEEFSFVQKEKYKAMSMGYEGERVCMIAILPREKFNLSEIEQEIDWSAYQELALDLRIQSMDVPKDEQALKEYKAWFSRSSPRTVKVSFPKFKIDSELSLKKVFSRLGVSQAFSDIGADFSGMHGRENDLGFLKIGEIRHKGVIEVNEDGSEAAAATAVRVDSRRMPVVEVFNANRPFLYLIVDKKTKLILFMGRVFYPLSGPK